MIEIGTVTECKGKRAKVEVDKKDECSKCGMCLFPKNASSVQFNAINKVGAEVGDTVEMANNESGKLLGALLVFLVPLIIIAISALVTYTLIGKEIFLLIISLPSIVLWYAVLSVIDKKIGRSKRFSPQITRIIKKAHEQNLEKTNLGE